MRDFEKEKEKEREKEKETDCLDHLNIEFSWVTTGGAAARENKAQIQASVDGN